MKRFSKLMALLLVCLLALGMLPVAPAKAAPAENLSQSVSAGTKLLLGSPNFQTFCTVNWPGSIALNIKPYTAYTWRCYSAPATYRTFNVDQACYETYKKYYKNIYSVLLNTTKNGWRCYGDNK